MKKSLKISFLILTLFLAGCLGSKQDPDEVLAIVRGTEITLGEVTFLYGEDNIWDGLRLLMAIELTKQEVEELNLDISTEWENNKDSIRDLPPKEEARGDEIEYWEFSEKQGKLLNMEPNEFFLEYIEQTMKNLSYFITYMVETVGHYDDMSEDEFNRLINDEVNRLMDVYDDEIEIFYKL